MSLMVSEIQSYVSCNGCNSRKAACDFYKDSQKSSGITARCKECMKAYSRSWRKHNGDKYKMAHKSSDLKASYGISLENYNQILANQDGGCAVCGGQQVYGRSYLDVDHDHACCPGKGSCGGCIRGLLCNRYNRMIAFAMDDVDILSKAIAYLGGCA